MNLEEFYARIGGNYADEGYPYMTIQVDGVKSFRADLDRRNSYDPLFYMFRYHISEAEYGQYDPAFRAIHTLKGVAQNLGFDRLYAASVPLTEALRGGQPLANRALLESVEAAHKEILSAIDELNA